MSFGKCVLQCNCHPSQGTDHVHHSRKVPLGPVVCWSQFLPRQFWISYPQIVLVASRWLWWEINVQSKAGLFFAETANYPHTVAYAPFLSIAQAPRGRSPWVYCCLCLNYQLMNKNVQSQTWNIALSVSPFNCLSFSLLYLNLCY